MDISVAQYVAFYGVILVIGWLLHWVYRWINPVCNGVLPPGSMGVPIIGETLDFLKASPSLDIPDFLKLRMKRYGPVFKTSLLGQPAVISTDAEVNRFVFQHEDTLFTIGYPWVVTKIFGEKSIQAFHGTIHKFVRRCTFTLLGLQSLREVLLPEMEGAVREGLAAWATKPSVDVRGGAPDLLFEMVTRRCVGFDSTKSRELRDKFDALFTGLFSFPIYFPGTPFYRCMQARKNVQKILRDTLAERLSTPGKKHGDLLDVIVQELQGEGPLISESFYGTLVTNEIIRISNAVVGIFRKTLTDVQVNGYTIPAGWQVIVNPMAVHLNEELFEDPLKFNPWRWMDESKRSTMLKNFLPFGAGIRACPAAEFVKLFVSLTLHILVMEYRWEEMKGADAFRSADVMFPHGYHIRLRTKDGKIN
ncbi:cytochrome P450 87A3-like [Triticum dicoccoides]|uniref:cytochrome P450 87A3-like n=1 Tax=Triticum dicoccoides TaxID=85692 RepID=UPI0018905425|nr:cytochrome P450 87A3-like [Triticum dicoccoides]